MRHIIRLVITLLIIGLSLPLYIGAQPIESEMERAVLKYVRTRYPDHLEKFKRMKLADPGQYEKEIKEIWQRTEELKILQKEHPELYGLEIRQEKLEDKTHLLARTYQTAKNEKEKGEIRRQLEKVVSEQFDAREEIKEYEVKQMEAELQEVKGKLRKRKANKNKIVEQRVNQLLNTSAGMGWE